MVFYIWVSECATEFVRGGNGTQIDRFEFNETQCSETCYNLIVIICKCVHLIFNTKKNKTEPKLSSQETNRECNKETHLMKEKMPIECRKLQPKIVNAI